MLLASCVCVFIMSVFGLLFGFLIVVLLFWLVPSGCLSWVLVLIV